ncbi:WSSV130 [White spot syndrome virus]|uniref:WSSV130 n=1 Tax=White spot syndrome virus TaxID=342409 RepID=A0A2I6SBQ2_9VIRU|nr:WSSV130 [White spot syndrome virus]
MDERIFFCTGVGIGAFLNTDALTEGNCCFLIMSVAYVGFNVAN